MRRPDGSLLAALLLAAGMSACSSANVAPGPEGPWVGTVTEADGVTTVVNESGSVWGGVATVVEEASAGGDGGSPDEVFGDVASVYEAGGTIYVVDAQAPAVRMFDHDGNGQVAPSEMQRDIVPPDIVY